MILQVVLLLVAIAQQHAVAGDCVPRNYGYSSFVCVCDAIYCDPINDVVVESGTATVVSSSMAADRFKESIIEFGNDLTDNGVSLTINRKVKMQSIIGFGGAFTDSATLNIASLSPPTQDQLLRSYFGPGSAEFTIGRINIGGCDFSSRQYTYDDVADDVTLSQFALQDEDLLYKIPMYKRAKEISNRDIRMFASPWTAPAWMKSNNALFGEGHLLQEHWQVWADYLIKFLNAYTEQDVHFWGITPQNEPIDGNIPGFTFNCMGWNATTQRDWIAEHLGPSLRNAGYGGLNLMIMDDQRFLLPGWAETVLTYPDAAQYVSGIAVHWYFDRSTPPSLLDDTNSMFPAYFMLATEACTGDNVWEDSVALGSWERAEAYMSDIIEDLNHWVAGWVDWNLALDTQGGPNWAENYVDAPIIVNATTDEFYRNPMFYALAHASKFVTPDSVRIESTVSSQTDLEFVAFERTDGVTVLLLLNRSEVDVILRILDSGRGNLDITVPAKSMHTILY